MHVTFTKQSGRQYTVTVVRERGPELAPRGGPGYDDSLPHDAVHFLVEAEAGITSGVFGELAAGRRNLFWAADPAVRRRYARQEKRRSPSAKERHDMAMSEQLAAICLPLWALRAGRGGTHARPDAPVPVPDAVLDRIVDRLDAFATRWEALGHGDSITLGWPAS